MAGLRRTSPVARSGLWFKSRRPVHGSSITLQPMTSALAAQHLQATHTSRSLLMPWMPWAETIGRPQSRTFAAEAQAEAREQLGYHFAILRQGRLAGVVSLHSIERHQQSGAIGIWLSRESNRKGIALQAVSLVITIAFRRLGLRQLFFRTAPRNRRGKHLAQRLHFRARWGAGQPKYPRSADQSQDLIELLLHR